MSALVDGQLDAETTERAWDHVLSCSECRGLVEREAWIKRRLSTMCGNEPSARLLGSLQSLQGLSAEGSPTLEGLEAWAEVDRLESQTRHRRRTGFAVAGAGSVAVLGFAALGSFGLGGPSGPPVTSISGGTGTPTSTPTSAVLPTVAEAHGRLRGWRVPAGSGVAIAVPLVAAE